MAVQHSRDGTLQSLLGPLAAYLFFFLQFLVPTETMFSLVEKIAHLIGMSFNHGVNKQIVVAVFLFFPYIFLVLIYRKIVFDVGLHHKVFMKGNLTNFSDEIRKIVRYHEKIDYDSIVHSIVSRRRHDDRQRAVDFILILLDILITDVRDVFEDMLQNSDIRVAVYVNTEDEFPDGSREELLQMVASTEFDKIYGASTKFRKAAGTENFQGFCGDAWNTGRPSCGTFRRLFFIKDKRFYLENSLDKGRSFLCLPVHYEVDENKQVCAILSIDSSRKYDFSLQEEIATAIYIFMLPVRDYVFRYIECINDINWDQGG